MLAVVSSHVMRPNFTRGVGVASRMFRKAATSKLRCIRGMMIAMRLGINAAETASKCEANLRSRQALGKAEGFEAEAN